MKKLLKLGLIVGGIAAISKMMDAKKAEWQGLTKSQAREKLESRLPSEIPDDKREMIIDKVVSKMHSKGVVSDDADIAVDLTAVDETVTAGTPGSDSA